jgi:hypothetical protein
MNPLLAEYNKRRNSRNVKTAREANNLLWACIHEAGHWAMLAHFNVMLVSAFVDRRRSVGSGCVDHGSYDLIPTHKVTEVECAVLLAGIYAIAELEPFITMQDNLFTSKDGDIKDVRRILDDVHGEDTAARKLFIETNGPPIRQIIHLNWSVIEALALELMKRGTLGWGDCRKIEIRYGIGYSSPTTPSRSAMQKLAAFHSSPATLLEALLAMS